MDWWNVLVYGVIPFITVVTLFFAKSKLLWISPIISGIASFVLSIVAMPSILSNKEYQGFLMWAMILQFLITTILTIIAYVVSQIIKK